MNNFRVIPVDGGEPHYFRLAQDSLAFAREHGGTREECGHWTGNVWRESFTQAEGHRQYCGPNERSGSGPK